MSNDQINISERPSIEPKWLFPLIDAGLVLLVWGMAYFLRYELELFRPVFDPTRAEFLPYLPYAIVYFVILFLNFQGNRLYRQIRGRAWMEEVSIIASATGTATVIVLAMFFAFQPAITSRLMLLYVAAFTFAILSLTRLVQRFVFAYLRGKGIGIQRVLIIGMNDIGMTLLRIVVSRPELGYQTIGYLDDDPQRGDVDLGRVKGLGTTENLETVIREQQIDLVMITLSWSHHDRILELARISQQYGVQVRVVPDVFQLNMRQVQVENLDGIALLGVGSQPFLSTNRLLKRIMDIVLIVIVAPLWVPIFLLVALAIRIEGKGEILYRQRRVGENGQEFDMIKFRSMIPDADLYREKLVQESGEDPRHPKIKDDPRITRTGNFIRRASLDELPNLVNVLMGHMSLVGPRPPTPDEVALYDTWHMQRLQITPGITGLWQVSGRSDVPFDEMCLMDIYYIENWSVRLDLQILFMTLPRVLLRSGAY